MPAKRYRIKEPTIAMFHDEECGIARKISAGTIVEVPAGSLDGNKLVEVIWDGRHVLMFTQDLKTRAEEIA
jgi:hypothetical protein